MITIRKILTQVEDTLSEAGLDADRPIRRVVVAAVVTNPCAGRYVEDMSSLVDASDDLGRQMGGLLMAAMGQPAQSYGKSALVGINGEVEHGHAFLTTRFADRLRQAVGGGKAWISSSVKRGTMGATIDVPLASKDALFVRSHYDTVTVGIPDAPEPNEVVVIIAAANRGRLNFRLGGLRFEDAKGEDGLR